MNETDLNHCAYQSTRYVATVLPIRSVGVQGDARTYSYAVGISSEKDPIWEDLLYFAK